MAGNDHIPTAPKDVIGDDGDLRQMRDALRAGKRVTLAPDGHVYVAPDVDAKASMTAAQEDFIEAKLGQVIEMARMGYGVSVAPDGTIAAERMDHKGRVRLDMDKGFSDDEKQLIQAAVSDGALVRLHPDGRVEYFLPADAKPPSGDHARQMEKFIADEISSGRLAKAWQDGETMAVQPDGSVVYVKVPEGPPAVEFPEDVRWGHDPLTTADQLEEEAKGLELGAGAARMNEHTDYQDAVGPASEQRDVAARARAGADAVAAAADQQLKDSQAKLDQNLAEQRQIAAQVAEKRNAGDSVGVEELAERYGTLLADARLAEQQVASAKAAAETSRATATKAATDQATGEAGVQAAGGRHEQLEDVFDSQEDQARVYRQAATEMREAERLDAAYADLKSRDVPDAERVKEAAAQHRARAEELRTKAEAFDDQPASTTPPDRPIPKDLRLPPPIFDEERRGPLGANEPPSVPDQPAVASAEPPADVVDPSSVVAAAADPITGDLGTTTADTVTPTDGAGAAVEIEMPPDDVSISAVAVDAPGLMDPQDGVTPDPVAADPLANDPMAGVATDTDPSFADGSDTTGPGAPIDGPGDDPGGEAFEG